MAECAGGEGMVEGAREEKSVRERDRGSLQTERVSGRQAKAENAPAFLCIHRADYAVKKARAGNEGRASFPAV